MKDRISVQQPSACLSQSLSPVRLWPTRNCLLPGLLEPSCHRCCPEGSPISSGSLSELNFSYKFALTRRGSVLGGEGREGRQEVGNLRAREGGLSGGMGHWVMAGLGCSGPAGEATGKKGSSVVEGAGAWWESRCPSEWARELAGNAS